MTQFLIEEALYERLEHVDREMKRRLGNIGIESDALDRGGSMSPGEIQQAEHAARMAQRTGGGI